MSTTYDKGLSYENITGNTAQLLIDVKENISGVLYYISICNIHDTDDAYVDLYFSKDISVDYFEHRRNFDEEPLTNFDEVTKQYKTYYIAKNLLIEQGNTLILDNEDIIPYDNSQYSLYIKLGASTSTVDVIMKQEIKL
tara:strand:+ start:1315 stop:1731 length:417 start_codon:yes stop_codon:yes gene_type:complete